MKTLTPSNVSTFLGFIQSLQQLKIYLHSFILDDNDWNLNKTDIIIGVFQEYKDHSPMCDREARPGRNLVDDPSLWTTSIPHPELSGKCFTYKYTRPSKSMNFILYLPFIQPEGVLCARCLLFSQVNHQSVHKFEGSDNKIFRIAIGNITKKESVEQMEHIKIFLHEKGKFNYFLEQDNMPDSLKIEPLTLKREHATTFKLR